jgi:hypothetical protein
VDLMLGQRYYVYLFYINALVNVTAFIPQILYKNRFNGSLSSLGLSTLIGTFLIILFQTQIKKFPGQNIAQIMDRLFPKWFQKTFLFLNFTLQIFAGMLFLISNTQIVTLFLTPNSIIVFYIFLLLIVFVIMNQTYSILYMLEIIVLLATPLYLFIMLRFFTDDLVMVDSIKQSWIYLMHFPKMNSVASGLFVFTGFTNFLIYGEHILPISKKKLLIVLGIICFVLFSSYFVPIGYFGLNGVGKESYVWATTVDSMRFDYFFLERMVSIFILVQIGVTLMYIIVSYHSSLQYLQLMTKNVGGRSKWVGIFVVVISALITQHFTDEFRLLKLFNYFFIFRIILDLFLMLILLFASKKQI